MGRMSMGRVSKDEVMQLLAADGGWMTAGALLNRLPDARNLDDVGAVLRGLVDDGEVQEIHGLSSLEYALAGVALPQGHYVPSRVITLDAGSYKAEPLRAGPPGGKAPSMPAPAKPKAVIPLPEPLPMPPPEQPATEPTAPAAAPFISHHKEPEMPKSTTKPRAANGETRARIAKLLQAEPDLTPRQIGERLGLATATASYHVKGLAKPKRGGKSAASKGAAKRGAKAVKAKPMRRRGKSVESELDEQLQKLVTFAPIKRLDEKRAVLKKLADHFPGNVAVLLEEISLDLATVAA